MKYEKGAERPELPPVVPESADAGNGALADPDGLLAAALALAAGGVKVFPCHRVTEDGCTCGNYACKSPGKHPRNDHGSKDATTDPDTIRTWWIKWGQHGRLNLGQTLTGRAVVDVDVAEGKPGDATWEALSADQDTPKTLTYRTGRGGLQMVFRLPEGETGGKADGYSNSLGTAVDFKTGPGAYVMVPGSKTDGVYTALHDVDPAPLPEWIAEHARVGVRTTSEDFSVVLAGSGSQLSDLRRLQVDDPYRSSNAWLTAVAGHHAKDAWQRVPRQPWTWYLDQIRADNSLSAVPHPEDRLLKTARSIWGTEERQHPESEAEDFERDVAQQQRQMRVRAEAARRERAETRPERPKLISGADFLTMDFGGVLWRIENLMSKGGNVLLAAQYKVGKTTFRNNLIKSFVDGEPFLGAFKVNHEGVLAVLDLEMPDEMAQDWLRRLKIQHPERFMYVPMLGRGASLNPTDPESVAEWAADLKAAGVITIMLDCLSPVMAALGVDEDKPSQVRPLLEGLNALKKQADADENFVIHHMGHNATRARGASSLLDWPDSIWNLTKDEQEVRYLSARGRGVDFQKTALEFNPETLALTLADAPEAEKPGLKQSLGKFPDLVRQHFAKYPAPLSKNKIAEAVGGNKKAVLASVDYLVDLEELEHGPKGYGPPSGALPGV